MDRVTERARVARVLGGWLVGVAIAATLVALARRTSLHEVIGVLRSANGPLLAVGVPVILGVGTLLRGARFAALLRDDAGRRPPLAKVLGSVVLSQAANNVLPLRAGELVRTRDFVSSGHPVARVASAQILEKAIELVTLVVLVAPVVAHGLVRHVWPVALALAAIALAVTFAIARGLGATRGWLARAAAWSPRDLLSSVGWSFLADAAEIALVAVTLRALGVRLGLDASIAVYAAVNLAIALPSTPGHLGALEAGAAMALIGLGTPRDAALAFALLYRLVQWVPVTLAGAVIVLARRAHRRAGAPPTESLPFVPTRSP